MLTITTEQARQRFTTLPPTLQDAVFSEQTAEIIASTIEKFHLADHRAEDIPTLVGWVLLGFLHLEDLAAEIEMAARVPKPVAKEIADSLTVKIFEPLRGALAQFHAPVPDAMTGIATSAPVSIKIEGMTAAPKIIGETTFTATPGSQKNVIIGPKVVAEVKPAGTAGAVGTGTASAPTKPVMPLAGDIGKPIPHFEPKPNIGGAMASSSAPVKKPQSTGEFARLAQQGGTPTPAPVVKPLVPVAPAQATTPIGSTPAATKPSTATPKPVMLQSNATPQPIQNAPNLNNPQKAVDILAGKKVPVPLPMKATVIEIGGAPKTGPQNAPTPTPPTPTRVVNYDNPAKPQASSAAMPGRQITEITSSPAQPPAQPQAPMPPRQMPASFQKPAPPAPTLSPTSPTPPMPTKPAPAPAILPTAQPQPKPQQPINPQQPIKPAGLSPIIVKNFTEGEK